MNHNTFFIAKLMEIKNKNFPIKSCSATDIMVRVAKKIYFNDETTFSHHN